MCRFGSKALFLSFLEKKWTNLLFQLFPITFKTSLYLKSVSDLSKSIESTILENSLFCWQFSETALNFAHDKS